MTPPHFDKFSIPNNKKRTQLHEAMGHENRFYFRDSISTRKIRKNLYRKIHNSFIYTQLPKADLPKPIEQSIGLGSSGLKE